MSWWLHIWAQGGGCLGWCRRQFPSILPEFVGLTLLLRCFLFFFFAVLGVKDSDAMLDFGYMYSSDSLAPISIALYPRMWSRKRCRLDLPEERDH
jgi:hypothetical protein